jgi:Secretion system C-terminal sorting domain
LPRGSFTTDSGRLNVQALAHVGGKDSVIGIGTVSIGADTNWYQVTANLVYTDTVHPIDTIRVAFFSSGGAAALDSSTLYVDDISMTSVPNPVIIDHTGVNEITAAGSVKVFPNPSAGTLYVDASLTEELTCILYALNGQQVASKNIAAGHGALDISSLPDGMYFYDIQSRNGAVVQRGKLVLSR